MHGLASPVLEGLEGQRSNYVGEMGISGNMRNDSRSSLNNGEELINWGSSGATHA